MALHYVIRSKKNPLKPNDDPKFYVVARSLPPVDRSTFIEDIVRHTSLTKNEAGSAIDYMFEALPRYIALGHTVLLGELGYFKAVIQSTGSENVEAVRVDNITRKRVIFVFGRKFQELINSLPVQEYPDI